MPVNISKANRSDKIMMLVSECSRVNTVGCYGYRYKEVKKVQKMPLDRV